MWVDYLRKGPVGPGAQLDRLLAERQVVMCGPVAAELVAGVASAQSSDLWPLLAGLPWADIGRREWRRVGEVAAALRAAGQAVALTDIEIAVAAATSGALLWSSDSDFMRVEAVLGDLTRYSGDDP